MPTSRPVRYEIEAQLGAVQELETEDESDAAADTDNTDIPLSTEIQDALGIGVPDADREMGVCMEIVKHSVGGGSIAGGDGEYVRAWNNGEKWDETLPTNGDNDSDEQVVNQYIFLYFPNSF